MQLKNSIKSIAIGSFDGIHKGHRHLIDKVEALVIIERNRGTLTPGYRRSFFMRQSCFFYHFDNIKKLRAKEFIVKLEEDFPKLETIVVGYDFVFGYEKEGNTTLLKKLFKGEVKIIDEVKLLDISIHSRIIKSFLSAGDLTIANRLLGRKFSFNGKVVKGQGLGRKELVPTLNLNIYDYVLPKHGVYLTSTKIKNQWFDSITFLGNRVTTDGSLAVETHVLDKDLGILSENIWTEFREFIRENRKFDNLKSLKEQIFKDIKSAKKIIERRSLSDNR